MPQEMKQQGSQTQANQNNGSSKSLDLNELAKKIVALLLRELDIERERTGR